MNSNLPIPYEPMAVPYLRPHKAEKRRSLRRFAILGLVLVFLTGILCAVHFLPEDMKNAFGALFFEDGTGVEETTETTETNTTDGTNAPPIKSENIYAWDYELPGGATAILPFDRSANTLGIYAENPTDAILEAVAPSFPKKGSGEVSVILLNTHSFETYAEDGALYYTDASFAANGAAEMRVSAVAQALCEALRENGIGAVFVDCMMDSSFGSYQNAQALAEIALEDHPEAVLVIDIHRAVMTSDTGALVRPITEIEDEILAQVRILLGSEANFEKNAATALSLYGALNLRYESLAMPLAVSESVLLQKLAVPVLTLEIGSAGNSVLEAERTAVLLAQMIAEMMA